MIHKSLWGYGCEEMVVGKYGVALSRGGSTRIEYRLGNRSALEWVMDQYQVSTDKRSGITNDPNRENDPNYILRLIRTNRDRQR
jgi:predicted helicase